VIIGKATAIDVALIDERIKAMLTVVNIKYLNVEVASGEMALQYCCNYINTNLGVRSLVFVFLSLT